jgi:hypothetical protein
MRSRAYRPEAVVVAGTLLMVGVARADDIERADEMFRKARDLLATDPAKACAMFDEAHTLNPHSEGILVNLAQCDENEGRVASAVANYKEAARMARERNHSCDEQCAKKYIEAAEHKIALLVGDVPHLTVTFAEPMKDARVLVAGKVVASLERIAVDPGDITLVVSAPGRVSYETHVEVRKHEDRSFEIPKLARSVDTSRALIGKSVIGVGAAALVGGVVLGVLAKKRYDEQFNSHACNPMTLVCTPEGDQQVKSARTLGTAGTVVGIVGLAAIGTGAVLWLTSPKAPTEPRVSLVPQVGTDALGVVAVGRF